MGQRVVAIGLDAAEPAVLEEYLAGGHLPVMASLRDQGARFAVQDFDLFSAETPWTTFATGRSPRKLGYWTPLRYDPADYRARARQAYEYEEYKPFFALGSEYRVAVFDLPQVRLHPEVNGVQVLAWGAHSPQTETVSQPPDLLPRIWEQHGEHPTLHSDYAECLRMDQVARLRRLLPIGIERRGRICRDLLRQEKWDLFITAFGEPHAAGHNMWQVSRPDHPLYSHFQGAFDGDPMLEVYQAIDRAIGTILEAVDQDTIVIVFSVHGMGANTMDLGSIVALPELMFRYSFPGERKLGSGRRAAPTPVGSPPPPPVVECIRNHFAWELWGNQEDESRLRRELRKRLPWGAYRRLLPLIGEPKRALVPPFGSDLECSWQPAQWYSSLWPQMKAFALPSFSEGYIRVNVRGRDPRGVVAPEEFDGVVKELTDLVEGLVDGRTGVKLARKIWRTRTSPFDDDPTLPEADLVVGWQERCATDTFDSPTLGRVGPLPHVRAGSHRPVGFSIIKGPEIPSGVELPRAHALDLAPTILRLLGAPVPEDMDGTALDLTRAAAAE